MSIHARAAIRILSAESPSSGDVVIASAIGELVTARVEGTRSLGAFPNAQAAVQAVMAMPDLASVHVWQLDDGQFAALR